MNDDSFRSVPLPGPLPAEAAPAVAVARRLQAAGHAAYLVGGAVRDLVLGGRPGDFDVATSAPPAVIEALFPRTEAVGRAFGVVLVLQDGVPVETATFRSEAGYRDGRRPDVVDFTAGLIDDARRRDFTVNALYLDPETGAILDPCGGLQDCAARLLRAVGDPAARFGEDGLRLLRAARLAAQCGLRVEPTTRAAMAAQRQMLQHISAERVGKEIALLLTGPDPARGLELLADTRLLDIVLPEVAALQGVPQPPEFHPEGDVWTHTLLMFRHSPRRSLPLGLAILLHDVGKPSTLTFAERIRFDGHAKLGAEQTVLIGRRLRLPGEIVAQASDLVAQHLRFLDVRRMRRSTLKRFLRQEHFAEHLELHRLDCLASHGDLGHYEFCRQQLEQLGQEDLAPRPLLQGRDLLALGYPEGPLLGEILRTLETAQLDGELQDPAQATAWVRSHYPLPDADAQ
jgi:tRNA nucleotidyltransferase/poly(A) polymerase